MLMEMYDQFLRRHPATGRLPGAVPPSKPPGIPSERGWDIVEQFCGATFSDGLYRLHTAQTSDRVASQIRQGFALAAMPHPFGFDWLGRQFVIGDHSTVLMYEPGTGQVLDIGVDLGAFHENELVSHPDEALAADFFETWRIATGVVDLDHSRCVGYRIPLFLGGEDTVNNLDLTDVEVYWELSSQLLRQVRGLPEGTAVRAARGK